MVFPFFVHMTTHAVCCNPILDSPRFSWMLFYFYYYL
jgi:hypothetical protein